MTDNDNVKFVPLSEFERRRATLRLADKYVGRDGGPPLPDVEQSLHELAEMSPAEYGRRRADIAAEIGSSRSFLDLEYRERRKAAKEDGGKVEFLRDPDPWPDPVRGDDLLAEIRDAADKHLILPDGGSEIVALWTLFTHCHDCFDTSPLLAFTSPTPECGKSTCLTLLSCLTPRALSASNITAAAVFRSVETWQPTLLIDEADTFVRDNDDLRGILNSGHHRSNAFVIRTTGENHEPKQFCTWTPKAVALIGKLPPTLGSRAIHIQLKRMLPGDRIEPLRLGRTGHLDPLLRKAARWAEDHVSELRAMPDPKMPEALYGRAADNWRPLIVIADLVGGDWPDRARHIAEKLGGRSEDLATVMILHDTASIFAERGVDRLPSTEITEALAKMEDRPWPEWKGGKPITPRQLAKLLDPLGVVPTTIRLDRKSVV
jgi:putative DNA primase/helicase